MIWYVNILAIYSGRVTQNGVSTCVYICVCSRPVFWTLLRGDAVLPESVKDTVCGTIEALPERDSSQLGDYRSRVWPHKLVSECYALAQGSQVTPTAKILSPACCGSESTALLLRQAGYSPTPSLLSVCGESLLLQVINYLKGLSTLSCVGRLSAVFGW